MALSLEIRSTKDTSTVSHTIQPADTGTWIDINEDIPANQTNLSLALVFAHAKLKFYHIVTSVDMTLEFNNSTTGVPTLNMKAGVPAIWYENNPHADLFSADVTGLFVTNTTAGNLRMRFLIDPT